MIKFNEDKITYGMLHFLYPLRIRTPRKDMYISHRKISIKTKGGKEERDYDIKYDSKIAIWTNH